MLNCLQLFCLGAVYKAELLCLHTQKLCTFLQVTFGDIKQLKHRDNLLGKERCKVVNIVHNVRKGTPLKFYSFGERDNFLHKTNFSGI